MTADKRITSEPGAGLRAWRHWRETVGFRVHHADWSATYDVIDAALVRESESAEREAALVADLADERKAHAIELAHVGMLGREQDAGRIVELEAVVQRARQAATIARLEGERVDPYARNPNPGRCKCGLHEVPAGCDGVNWYWGHHTRAKCTVELPNEQCWCGRLRTEHQDDMGHAKPTPSDGEATKKVKQ